MVSRPIAWKWASTPDRADHSSTNDLKRDLEPEVVERRRPEADGEVVHGPAQLVGDALDDVEPRQGRRGERFGVADAPDRQGQGREELADRVVQLAGDPAAFVLLRGDEAAEEVGPGGDRLAALGDVLEEPAEPGGRGPLAIDPVTFMATSRGLSPAAHPDLELVRAGPLHQPEQRLVEEPAAPLDDEQAERLADEEFLPAGEQRGGGVVRFEDQPLVIGHQPGVERKLERLLIPEPVGRRVVDSAVMVSVRSRSMVMLFTARRGHPEAAEPGSSPA